MRHGVHTEVSLRHSSLPQEQVGSTHAVHDPQVSHTSKHIQICQAQVINNHEGF